MIHWLKTRKEFFEEVWDGNKPFEIRNNDRNFMVDDLLILAEGTAASADKAVMARVSSVVFPGDQIGIVSGYVILGLKILGRIDDDVVMFEHTRSHIKSDEWQSHSLKRRVTAAELNT